MKLTFTIDTDLMAEHFISKSIEAFMPLVREDVTEEMIRENFEPKLRKYFDNLDHQEIENLIMTGVAEKMFPTQEGLDEHES